MSESSSAVQDQVVRSVEQLTRFDRKSISLLGESYESLKCSMTWTSDVTFAARVTDGCGRLSGNVVIVASQAEMERRANLELSNEHADLGQRLNAWVHRRNSLSLSDEPSLSVNDCFGGTKTFGYTYTCGSCQGSGQVRCGTCGGGGTITCYGCSGGGTVPRTITRQVMGSNGQYTTVTEYIRVSCGNCGGGGRVRCGNCSGSGRVRCSVCAGTGIRNRYASTRCEIADTYKTALPDQRPEVQNEVSRWTFRQMIAFGQVRRGECSVSGMRVVRRFEASVPLTTTRLNCNNSILRFFGYGHAAKVLNFKNVVGVLLTEDLAVLRQVLNYRWSWLPFSPNRGLRTAMSNMLDSEVHKAICDSEEERAALKARGIVSEDHSRETLKALRRGMGRLFRSGWTVNASLVTASILAYESLMGIFFWRVRLSFPVIVLLLLLLIAAVGYAGDWYAQRRTLQHFRPDRQNTALTLLRSTGALARWRKWTAVVVVVSVLILPGIVVGYEYLNPPKHLAAIQPQPLVYDTVALTRMAKGSRPARTITFSSSATIRGDVNGINIHSTRGDVMVTGRVSHSSILVDDGSIDVEMTATASTLKARIIAARVVSSSTLTCEKCAGTFAKDVHVNHIVWPRERP